MLLCRKGQIEVLGIVALVAIFAIAIFAIASRSPSTTGQFPSTNNPLPYQADVLKCKCTYQCQNNDLGIHVHEYTFQISKEVVSDCDTLCDQNKKTAIQLGQTQHPKTPEDTCSVTGAVEISP